MSWRDKLAKLFGCQQPTSRFQRPPTEVQIPKRSLAELADEYVAHMGRYDRNSNEVYDLRRRVGTLMRKHGIKKIARKDCLISMDHHCWGGFVNIEALPPRLDDQMPEDMLVPHLIPLVDRLLEADGDFGKDKQRRGELEKPLVEAMKAANLESFIHRGYCFERFYTLIRVYTLADFDG
jgi:hypothetical protein